MHNIKAGIHLTRSLFQKVFNISPNFPGGKKIFNGFVHELTISEEWTATGRLFQPFFDAFILGWPLHQEDEEEERKPFYPRI
jgi:hypothetical protein